MGISIENMPGEQRRGKDKWQAHQARDAHVLWIGPGSEAADDEGGHFIGGEHQQ
jgi:hypothetical protein